MSESREEMRCRCPRGCGRSDELEAESACLTLDQTAARREMGRLDMRAAFRASDFNQNERQASDSEQPRPPINMQATE